MENKTVILLSEDDEGQAKLFTSNIKRIGIKHEIVVFRNGIDHISFSNAKRKLGRYIHRDVMPQLNYDFSN